MSLDRNNWGNMGYVTYSQNNGPKGRDGSWTVKTGKTFIDTI